ncbi:MAG: translesion DNA synthesis-associated protein ImuA [Pseudomonadota bacterium]
MQHRPTGHSPGSGTNSIAPVSSIATLATSSITSLAATIAPGETLDFIEDAAKNTVKNTIDNEEMAETSAATKATGTVKKLEATQNADSVTPSQKRWKNHLPDSLRTVINRRDTWLGRNEFNDRALNGVDAGAANNDVHYHPSLKTGFAALDARLCENGWPLGTCIEVLSDASGMGAMGLFLPAMQSLSKQARWQAFIAPPYVPYAPLLAAREISTEQILLVHPRNREEQLWSTEQALRSGTCSAVFSWLGGEYRYAELRRLQLAATRGNSLAVLFRPQETAHQHSPAALRLQMSAYRQVHILKQRSGMQGLEVYLPPEDDVPNQPQLWELPADSPESYTGNKIGKVQVAPMGCT